MQWSNKTTPTKALVRSCQHSKSDVCYFQIDVTLLQNNETHCSTSHLRTKFPTTPFENSIRLTWDSQSMACPQPVRIKPFPSTILLILSNNLQVGKCKGWHTIQTSLVNEPLTVILSFETGIDGTQVQLSNPEFFFFPSRIFLPWSPLFGSVGLQQYLHTLRCHLWLWIPLCILS